MKILAVRYSLPLLVLAATLIGLPSPALAITLGQLDDFQDGGVANWFVAGGQVTFANVPDAGPLGIGDNVLNADCMNRFVFYNENQWKGDYIAAGVTKISMDVRHENAFPLQLRLGIAKGEIRGGGSGDTYVTDYSIAIPNDGQWRRITFDVAPDDFVPSPGNTGPAPSATAALMGVTHLRILHNPTPGDFLGESNPGSMRVNNILAEGDVVEDADFDGDDDVDGNDFLIWQRGLGVGTTQPTGDADGNGSVNALDLAVWKAQFGMPAMQAVAAIPEPASVGLAALAVLAGILARRNRRNIRAIPEPTGIAMVASALGALGVTRRFRRRGRTATASRAMILTQSQSAAAA
ncbi:MAG: PEP-CTERM sorting domain-containing protein [Pirellulales bacterium]|nr:PEP-CTERM sorting domain-containing protein [Pirellulales bacterium]